ncbi:RNA-guided endonuclease TnpB family protein [Rhabdochromatium marinum]|uniref:RNA-guided endonuclease TnpB family protein n=1 Tax=Rhabdochromatium marinum TaxID=48729 RepID=UPI001905EF1C|nr:RNA-guided endonuclease TnpB family protein [Rhabdochromatium marinum]MBK1649610.1 transposase [Rhabdochromatium marinum]
MKVTRILRAKRPNKGKVAALREQARRLGLLRSEVWQRFGSRQGVDLSDRQIRDAWLGEGRTFPVSANAWKETLRDAKGDITANMEAAKVKARRCIWRHTQDKTEQKRLFSALKRTGWTRDPYLRRVMRKHWHRGHNHTHNQIIVRSDNYTTFHLGGRAWIKIPGLIKGQRIAIPLDTTGTPTGTLRIILTDEDRIEVHYTIDAEITQDSGERTIGVDKGYSEVLVDSDGEHHGQELGRILTEQSDTFKAKYQRRAKLRARANNTRNPRKREHIRRFNLGRKKLNRQIDKTHARIRDVVFQSVHKVVDKAAVIAAEDLTAPMAGKSFGKNVNRRLASWTKGVIAEALDRVSIRRGSAVVLINPAYTSQIDSRTGCLDGQRRGDRFYCSDGVVLQADQNAARNVLARLSDPDIDRFTSFKQVKAILQARTERLRLGLLNQDSSCSPGQSRVLSTESESPKNHHEQLCLGF